jgi:hypothetical protein
MNVAPVASNRIQKCNDKPVLRDGDYVIYWMTGTLLCVEPFQGS